MNVPVKRVNNPPHSYGNLIDSSLMLCSLTTRRITVKEIRRFVDDKAPAVLTEWGAQSSVELWWSKNHSMILQP